MGASSSEQLILRGPVCGMTRNPTLMIQIQNRIVTRKATSSHWRLRLALACQGKSRTLPARPPPRKRMAHLALRHPKKAIDFLIPTHYLTLEALRIPRTRTRTLLCRPHCPISGLVEAWDLVLPRSYSLHPSSVTSGRLFAMAIVVLRWLILFPFHQ
jgi:hypothetical protein